MELSDWADELLELADEAWQKVFKEKLMERIRANDTKIDQMVDIVAEANHMRWCNKLKHEQTAWNYEDQLMDLLHSSDEKETPSK